jgi:hypothetical protein
MRGRYSLDIVEWLTPYDLPISVRALPAENGGAVGAPAVPNH